MIRQPFNPKKQHGSMLLEALISVVIFSMGILAIIGLQAASVRASTDAKYRTEASFLANELVGKMWGHTRTAAALEAEFEGSLGSGGPGYLAWCGQINDLKDGTVMKTLPGAQTNPPTVAIQQITNSSGNQSAQVTITVNWLLPGEADDASPHSYVTVAQII